MNCGTVVSPITITCNLSYSDYKRKYQRVIKENITQHPMLLKNIKPVLSKESLKQYKLTQAYVQSSPIHKKIAMNIIHRKIFKLTSYKK